jgi:hypothetical protein
MSKYKIEIDNENKIIAMLEDIKKLPLGTTENHVILGLNIAINVIKTEQLRRRTVELRDEISGLETEIEDLEEKIAEEEASQE